MENDFGKDISEEIIIKLKIILDKLNELIKKNEKERSNPPVYRF